MKLQVFKNEQFGQVRTLEINNEPWFVGKDVAEILGYQNPSKALKDHVDEEDKLYNETLLSLGQRGGWIINESGLYSLILKSKLPQVKQFKRWVTSEVLPSIRKTGAYYSSAEAVTEDALIFVLETQKNLKERQALLEVEQADIKSDLHYLKDEQPINPDVRLDLEKARKKSVIGHLGGMDSPAYADKSLSQKVFRQAMTDFKERFQVSRYDLLPKKAIEEAYNYWRNWTPPTNLKLEIQSVNDQMRFDF